MRDLDEKRRYEIELYMQNDPPSMPGWLFLTPQIVSQYGICPFLAVSEPPETVILKRRVWLEGLNDGGAAYRSAFVELASPERTDELTVVAETARTELTRDLEAAFHERPDLPPLAPLLEVMTSYKQSKNRSKRVKTAWEKTMEDIRRVDSAIGFDMMLYYDILTGAKLTKSAIADICSSQQEMNKLRRGIRAVVTADKALRMHREHVHSQYVKATDKLYDLICADFVIAQEGRYFKRWYNLSTEEKNERIDSFCEHHLSTLVAAKDRSRLLDELQAFIRDSLAKKNLKISEVKWSTKAGKIEQIQRLNFDGEKFYLDVEDQDAKRLRRTQIEFNNSEKERALAKIDSERLNRVLLKRILAYPEQRKDEVISFVLAKCCHCTTPQVKASTRDHLVSSYAAIVDAIRAAPPPSLLNLTT